MFKSKFLIYFLLLVYVVVVIYFRLIEPYEGIIFPLDLSYLIAPIIAVLAVIYAMSKTKGKPNHSFVMVAGVGTMFWFLGEISWTTYELVTRNIPFPSIADFFFLAAYPLWLYAVIREVRSDYLSARGKWFWPGMALLAFAWVITFYFGILKSYDIEAPLLENLVNVAYGLSDLMVLTIGGLLINISSASGHYVKQFSLISLAMLLTWIADILYYTVFMEPYNNLVVPFRLIDLLWLSLYLLMARAFYLFAKEDTSPK